MIYIMYHLVSTLDVGAIFGNSRLCLLKMGLFYFFYKLQKKVLHFACKYFKTESLKVMPNSVNGK